MKEGSKEFSYFQVIFYHWPILQNYSLIWFIDGLANQGLCKPEQITGLVKDIHAQGITVSSFGIGSDFDETLMRSIAEYPQKIHK